VRTGSLRSPSPLDSPPELIRLTRPSRTALRGAGPAIGPYSNWQPGGGSRWSLLNLLLVGRDERRLCSYWTQGSSRGIGADGRERPPPTACGARAAGRGGEVRRLARAAGRAGIPVTGQLDALLAIRSVVMAAFEERARGQPGAAPAVSAASTGSRLSWWRHDRWSGRRSATRSTSGTEGQPTAVGLVSGPGEVQRRVRSEGSRRPSRERSRPPCHCAGWRLPAACGGSGRRPAPSSTDRGWQLLAQPTPGPRWGGHGSAGSAGSWP
jgi:hypothetical protein